MREYDRTYALVNLAAIRHNILQVRNNIRKETSIMAIVKADAYGHGAIPVAKALENLVDAYGVALIEEALELREAGLQQMILILGYTGEEWYEELVRHRISQTIYTYDMAQKLNDTAAKMGRTTPIHIKLDTGMGRIGFRADETSISTVKKICEMPFLEPEGIFTHFARADEADKESVSEQIKVYGQFVQMLKEKGLSIPVKHCSNSAGIIDLPEANWDMVRAGISIYGLYPSDQVKQSQVALTPAMELNSFITYVKRIEEGTPVSYGGTFVAPKPMTVATVSVGYGDGYPRNLSGKGRVLIHGESARILGRVCMDQIVVDVTHIPEAKEWDQVTLLGRQNGEQILAEELAKSSGGFHYEIVCNIGKRVPRVYRKDGNVVGTMYFEAVISHV